MSATIASGMVSDIPNVATSGVVHTTHNALVTKNIKTKKTLKLLMPISLIETIVALLPKVV